MSNTGSYVLRPETDSLIKHMSGDLRYLEIRYKTEENSILIRESLISLFTLQVFIGFRSKTRENAKIP